MKEFRVIVTLKNNLLASTREKMGHNQSAMAEICGVAPTIYGELENLKRSPWTKVGKWSAHAERIAAVCRMLPEDLWPEVFKKVEKRRIVKEVGAEEMFGQLGSAPETPQVLLEDSELRYQTARALRSLDPKEQFIVERLYGFYDGRDWTQTEIAEVLGLSTGRVHELLNRAFRKLKHPSRKKKLEPFVDAE